MQVDSLEEVFNASFTPQHNVILFGPRPGFRLKGNFDGVARKIIKMATERHFFADATSTYHAFNDVTCYTPLTEIENHFSRNKLTPAEGRAMAQILSDVQMFKERRYRADLRVQTDVYDMTRPIGDSTGAHADFVDERIIRAYCGTTTIGWGIGDAACDGEGEVLEKPDMSRAFRMPLGAVWKQAGLATMRGSIPPFVHTHGVAKKGRPRMFIVADKLSR